MGKWSLLHRKKKEPDETKEEMIERLREPLITIATVEADNKETAKSEFRKIGLEPDEYDYLLEYKPPDTENTPPGAKEELKQLLLLFGSNPLENKCKPEQKVTQLFLF